MNKMMTLLALLLGISLVFIGGRSFAEESVYWETNFGGIAPYNQGYEGQVGESAHQESDWQRITGGLDSLAPAEPLEGTMQGTHEPSNYERSIGGPFFPYSGGD